MNPSTVSESSSYDPVNHPKHYTSHPSGVECITITRHMSFNIGNAVKYLWRADEKGAAIEDLKKAAWYIADEIAKRAPPETCDGCRSPNPNLYAFGKEWTCPRCKRVYACVHAPDGGKVWWG